MSLALRDVQGVRLRLVPPLGALERVRGEGEPPLRGIVFLPTMKIRLIARELADERRGRIRRPVWLSLCDQDVNLGAYQGLERGPSLAAA